MPAQPTRDLHLVGIDGRGGSGKSTLAEMVSQARSDVHVVHGDDFYGPEKRDWQSWTPREGYERYFDHRRLERELLRPLRRNEVGAFQRYDWASRSLGNYVYIEPRGVVVVEGVYVLRRSLRRYWDLAVYVETPREVCRARLNSRGENDEGWIDRWAAAEDYYEEVEHPERWADLRLHGG